MLRMLEMAPASFEARRDDMRLGMAMAAMMPMIATTIINSISEKPLWPFLFCSCFTALLRVQTRSGEIVTRAIGHRLRLRAGVARLLGRSLVLRAACVAGSQGPAAGTADLS